MVLEVITFNYHFIGSMTKEETPSVLKIQYFSVVLELTEEYNHTKSQKFHNGFFVYINKVVIRTFTDTVF